MGKAEGAPLITDKMPWHGHVTAVTVDPDYRRLGLADGLMHGLEEISEKIHDAFFVDLFVRVSNTVAVRAAPRALSWLRVPGGSAKLCAAPRASPPA